MTNPKQMYGDKKPPLGQVPLTALIHGALAFYDGKGKYGDRNWRKNPVQAQTYVEAILRHVLLWANGEEFARDTGVHNLGGVIASAGLLLDAQANGVLLDNRVKSPAACDLLHDAEDIIAKLNEQHKARREAQEMAEQKADTEAPSDIEDCSFCGGAGIDNHLNDCVKCGGTGNQRVTRPLEVDPPGDDPIVDPKAIWPDYDPAVEASGESADAGDRMASAAFGIGQNPHPFYVSPRALIEVDGFYLEPTKAYRVKSVEASGGMPPTREQVVEADEYCIVCERGVHYLTSDEAYICDGAALDRVEKVSTPDPKKQWAIDPVFDIGWDTEDRSGKSGPHDTDFPEPHL